MDEGQPLLFSYYQDHRRGDRDEEGALQGPADEIEALGIKEILDSYPESKAVPAEEFLERVKAEYPTYEMKDVLLQITYQKQIKINIQRKEDGEHYIIAKDLKPKPIGMYLGKYGFVEGKGPLI